MVIRNIAMCIGLLLIVPLHVSAEDYEKHNQAAFKLLQVLEVGTLEQRALDTADTLIKMGLVPSEARDSIAVKLERLYSSEEFRDINAKMYMNRFSTEELNRISVALSDPVVRTFISQRQELMQEGMQSVAPLFDKFGITEEFLTQ